MPFQSEAQRRYLFAKHPTIAKRWAETYGVPSDLPARKHASKKPDRRAYRERVLKRLT